MDFCLSSDSKRVVNYSRIVDLNLMIGPITFAFCVFFLAVCIILSLDIMTHRISGGRVWKTLRKVYNFIFVRGID